MRPFLKRVVPGSVPPWRALCAESARVLKCFFPILWVSRKFLNLFCCSSRSCQILRALNLRSFWAPATACGPVVLRPSLKRVVTGHVLKAGFSKRSCRFIKPRWQLYDGCGGKGQPLGLAQPLLRRISSLSAARFPGARCFSWAMFSRPRRGFPLLAVKKGVRFHYA